MTTVTQPLADFNRLSMQGHGDLTLVQGSAPSITIETDPETLEHLKVEVENGELILGWKSWLDFLFQMGKKVRYTVTYPTLTALSISGSCKARSGPIEGESFQFHISGSGSLTAPQMNVQNLEVRISGSAEVDLAGTAVRQDVRVSGSGKVVARGLASQAAQVRVSGSGDLTLNVSQTLNVTVSGSASVAYLGSPQIQQSISGSASIRQIV